MTTEAAEIIYRHAIRTALTELNEHDARAMIQRIAERPAEFVEFVQGQIEAAA